MQNHDYYEFKSYRKKPIVIRAKQSSVPFTVETMEGKMQGNTGDYLVFGAFGEPYIVAKAIFEATYDEVKEDA